MTLTSGEQLKEQVRGVDVSRAMRNFRGEESESSATFRSIMAQGVYAPNMVDLEAVRGDITNFMRSGQIQVVIPMYEKGGPPDFVPREVLEYLVRVCEIPKQNILVVNHRSEKPAIEEAQSWEVPVVNALQIIGCLECEVTEITGLSRLFTGKGIAVLAGLLTVREQMERGVINPRYIMFHDSELVGVEKYNGARHLCYPLVVSPDQHNHVIGAQIDRGNEAVFAARAALESLEYTHPDEQVRRYIASIRLPLTRLVWMLTGERVLRAPDLFQLPLATGYVLETIMGVGIEGLNLNGSQATTAQVVIPGARLDGCNGCWAEQLMMIMICRALNVFALQGKPPSQWSVDRIRGINRIFSRMNLLPMLSQEAGPVECKEREADRVIPSIDNIYKQKWVDRDRLGGILDQLF